MHRIPHSAIAVLCLCASLSSRISPAEQVYCLPLDMDVAEKEALLDPESPTYDPNAWDCDTPDYNWELDAWPCLARVGQSCTTSGETLCRYGQGAVRSMLEALIKNRNLTSVALAGIRTCLRDGAVVQGIWYPYGFGVQCSGDFMGNLTYTVFSADVL